MLQLSERGSRGDVDALVEMLGLVSRESRGDVESHYEAAKCKHNSNTMMSQECKISKPGESRKLLWMSKSHRCGRNKKLDSRKIKGNFNL